MALPPYHRLEQKIVAQLNQKRLPSFKQFKYLNKLLNPKESWLLTIGTIIISSGLILLGIGLYKNHVKTKPTEGGRYIEGIVGQPQLINPLYASLSKVDADLSRLIYSSLFTRDKNGFLTPDLVEDYQFASSTKTYTFKIKHGVKWHTGGELTSDDVLFTLERIQDVRYKSPLRVSFLGVTSQKIDDHSFSLTLPENYAPFIELLTFGILPKTLWEEIGPENNSLAELNIKPVGSGPYQFNLLTKDKSGHIKNYTLTANSDYYFSKPFIEKIVFRFFSSPEELVEALNYGSIDGADHLNPELLNNLTAQNAYTIEKIKNSNNVGIFFNLRLKDSLINKYNIRQALALAIDKQKLIEEIFQDYATPLNSPINQNSFGFSGDTKNYDYNITEAKRLLEAEKISLSDITDESGSKKILTKNNQPITLKVSAVNDLEQIKVAEAISAAWQDLGFLVELDIVDKKDLSSKIIRPKNFEILLFSWSAGVDPDPYQMWHSSQSGEKGFNLSGYANKKIDELLEDARLNHDLNKRQKDYQEFQKLLTADLPTIFLYQPYHIFIHDKGLKGFTTQVITTPEDRFNSVSSWYLKESKTLK